VGANLEGCLLCWQLLVDLILHPLLLLLLLQLSFALFVAQQAAVAVQQLAAPIRCFWWPVKA
jgi:hypothetical protein